jgi:hypothetical protein
MDVRGEDGKIYVVQNKWLRETDNPIAPKYPKTGDKITLKDHALVKDGTYTVSMVTEWEPPYDKDEDGRDIRISFCEHSFRELNGVNIRKAMVKL